MTSISALGHLHPIVPLARALIGAGHEVLIGAPETLRPRVEGLGLPYAQAGPTVSEMPAEIFQQLRAVRHDWQEYIRRGMTLLFAGYRPRRALTDVLQLIDTWRPDVVLQDVFDFGSGLAAEKRGIPHVVTGPVWFMPSWLREVVADALAPLRAEFGLPADPMAAAQYRYLALAPIPRSWVAADEPVPATAHFIRPEPFNASGEEALPERLAHLTGGRPLVHASLGTVFNDAPGIVEAIVAGLRDEPLNLVVTIGHQQDPASFGPQPDNVIIERYIPHELLLPLCDVMLTHCGLNSAMACLTLGLPMVAVPITADQPRNAARLAALGAAVVVEQSERTPEAFRAATWTVLNNLSFRRGAEAIRDEIAAMPGSEHAVELLERLARERQPLVAAGQGHFPR
jgi:MGT family glycosyltransferase